jgi:hypothetical protein
MEPIVADGKNWHRADEMSEGIVEDVLLRAGPGLLDPVYVGRRIDGRFIVDSAEAHPTHYCLIPRFDADDGEAS